MVIWFLAFLFKTHEQKNTKRAGKNPHVRGKYEDEINQD